MVNQQYLTPIKHYTSIAIHFHILCLTMTPSTILLYFLYSNVMHLANGYLHESLVQKGQEWEPCNLSLLNYSSPVT